MDWTPFDADDRAALDAAIPSAEDSPVVIVDDEVQVLDLLKKVLGREGYPVDVFESGQNALPRIKEGGVSLLITALFALAMFAGAFAMAGRRAAGDLR